MHASWRTVHETAAGDRRGRTSGPTTCRPFARITPGSVTVFIDLPLIGGGAVRLLLVARVYVPGARDVDE
jgi:hypothetical protein